jgi:hypothetical protein
MANPNVILANPNVIPVPSQIPHIRLVPVKGGLGNRNFISQVAINFLTECVWENLICTPTKLKTKSAPSCLDFAQVAMPMIHPKTGKSIISYKQLMHDPAMSEVWQTEFYKDFGGMAQGDNKMGRKGTNSIFVMTHDEVKRIPKNQTPRMLALLSISIHRKQTHTIFESRQRGTSFTIPANYLPARQTLPHPN